LTEPFEVAAGFLQPFITQAGTVGAQLEQGLIQCLFVHPAGKNSQELRIALFDKLQAPVFRGLGLGAGSSIGNNRTDGGAGAVFENSFRFITG
jgi:hypothetical protein